MDLTIFLKIPWSQEFFSSEIESWMEGFYRDKGITTIAYARPWKSCNVQYPCPSLPLNTRIQSLYQAAFVKTPDTLRQHARFIGTTIRAYDITHDHFTPLLETVVVDVSFLEKILLGETHEKEYALDLLQNNPFSRDFMDWIRYVEDRGDYEVEQQTADHTHQLHMAPHNHSPMMLSLETIIPIKTGRDYS